MCQDLRGRGSAPNLGDLGMFWYLLRNIEIFWIIFEGFKCFLTLLISRVLGLPGIKGGGQILPPSVNSSKIEIMEFFLV